MIEVSEIVKRHKGVNLLVLGNGPSGLYDFSEYWDNVPGENACWTVNGNWENHPYSNLGWMMDSWNSPAHDLDRNTREEKLKHLQKTTIPVFTPAEVDYIECLVRYPIETIIDCFPDLYFGESFSYAIAFAIYCGVKRIDFYGTDYHGCKASERACTEGWVFLAKSKGIEVNTSPKSSFMRCDVDNINIFNPFFYGYLPCDLPESITGQGVEFYRGEEDADRQE